MTTTRKAKINNVFILILLSLISCKTDNEQDLYKVIVYDYKNNLYNRYNVPIIIPIYNNEDSVYCCSTSKGFYDNSGIYIINYEDFTKKLYHYIVNNKHIQVSDSFFESLKEKSRIIIEDPQVKKIYQEEGIDGVIKKYVNKYGEISYEDHSLSTIYYIYYLCFINNIYFYWADEGGPGYFIDATIVR